MMKIIIVSMLKLFTGKDKVIAVQAVKSIGILSNEKLARILIQVQGQFSAIHKLLMHLVKRENLVQLSNLQLGKLLNNWGGISLKFGKLEIIEKPVLRDYNLKDLPI